MNSYSYIRSVICATVCVAATLAASVSFGSAADRQQVQAQLLDHAEFLCANCFFGASDYYYCFAADNKVLIGYQRTPVLNWRDKSKNYLTKVHDGWTAWTASGQTVPISYDDKHIWVNRVDGKQVRTGHRFLWIRFSAIRGFGGGKQVKLTRSSLRDIFINNDQCRDSGGAKAH